jgi:hypothetical protein
LRGVVAEALRPGIHGLTKLGFVVRDLGVIELARPVIPRSLWKRDQGVDDPSHAGVQDRGHAAGTRECPGVDRGPYQLAGVQSGRLSGPQGPPQPGGFWPQVSVLVLLGQRIVDELVVALPVGFPGQVGPAGVQQAQVVSVGQAAALVLAGAGFGLVAIHAIGQHRDRVAHLVVGLRGGLSGQAGPFLLDALAPC